VALILLVHETSEMTD